MPLMTGSLSDSARRLGGSGYASSARRLRNKGYGRAAEQMALAGETERMQKGSGITRAEDRVVGGQIEERQTAALNKLRMQRLVSGYRGDISRNQGGATRQDDNYFGDKYRRDVEERGGTTPQRTVYAGNGGYVPRTSKPAAGETRAPATTGKPADPNWTDDPFKSAALEEKRSKEGERRAAMQAQLDKVTGATGASNAADMDKQFQTERTEAIKTARERASTEGGYTTRGSVIEEMNKSRRAAGQREFDVTGKDFADVDRANQPAAAATPKMTDEERAADIASRVKTINEGLAKTRAEKAADTAFAESGDFASNVSPEERERVHQLGAELVAKKRATGAKGPFLNLGDGPNKVGAKDARATFSVAHRGRTPEDALAWAKELASVDMENTKKRQEALKVAQSKVTIPSWQEGTILGGVNRWGKRTLTQLPDK